MARVLTGVTLYRILTLDIDIRWGDLGSLSTLTPNTESAGILGFCVDGIPNIYPLDLIYLFASFS